MDRHLERAFRKQGIEKIEGDTYNVSFPSDEHGRTGRECKNPECSPAYFMIKGGTGLSEPQEFSYCPYCRHEDAPNNFFTQEQLRYTKDKMGQAMVDALSDKFESTFGGRKKRYDGGLISMEISFDRGRPKNIRRPLEEELKRVIVCPSCCLEHAVFGLAFWCPDCGADLFLENVKAEFQVVDSMIGDIDRRRHELGDRIAAKDAENCLEDTVSIFEVVMKIILRKKLLEAGSTTEDLEKVFKKVGNAFQNVTRARDVIKEHLGVDIWACLKDSEFDFVQFTFEKRHPITHNLGVVDKKYLEKAMTMEREGQEVRVHEQEIRELIRLCLRVIEHTSQEGEMNNEF
jgi:hypothetical protein